MGMVAGIGRQRGVRTKVQKAERIVCDWRERGHSAAVDVEELGYFFAAPPFRARFPSNLEIWLNVSAMNLLIVAPEV